MTDFNLDVCDVEKIVYDRYKVSPVSIDPWFDDVLINANAVSTQNDVYTWRFSGAPDVNPAVADKRFPFYVGWMRLNIYNGDPTTGSIANSFVEISDFNLDSIGTFYNTTAERLIRFGVGSFNGQPFPAAGINVAFNNQNNPHFVCGPWMTVQVFTDATGAVFLQVGVSFQGYKVFIS